MEIIRKFGPVTIVIDNEEDLLLIINSLLKASFEHERRGIGRKMSDEEQKIYHLYQQLHKIL